MRQKHDNAKNVAAAAAYPLTDPVAASAGVGTTARSLLVDSALPDFPLSFIRSAA